MRKTSMMRWWQVWSSAWEAERRQPIGVAPSGTSLEFQPAALEIQVAPPSPIGRAMLWTIMALLTVSVVWASVGQIDIVATAQGKIIPSGYSKGGPALRNRRHRGDPSAGRPGGATGRGAD